MWLPFLGDGGEQKRQCLASSGPWKGKTVARGSTSAAKLYLHKKIFPCAWGKSRGEKCLCSRLQDWFYWCVILHLSLSSLFSLLCQLALTLLHSHPSQLSCLPALLAPGHLHSHSQAPLLHQLPLNLSGSTGVPPALCVCAVHILLISAL